MKTRSKALLLALCAVLLVAASVFGTMAYLTSTDEVKNTFTVGQVSIKLDEAKVNGDGEPVDKNDKVVTVPADAERVKGNSYKLMPGHTYTKDPTVTVLKGSEESYVRLLVTVNFEKELTAAVLGNTKMEDIFTGYSADWKQVDYKFKNNVTVGEGDGAKIYGTVITYEYRYKDTVSALNDDVKLPALFTAISVPDSWTNETLAAIGGFDINIVGQAIQADGFVADEENGKSAADVAWENF